MERGHRHQAVSIALENTAQQSPPNEALKTYDATLEVFGPKISSDDHARRLVIRAMYEKALVYDRLGRLDEADALVRELARQFSSDSDPENRRLVCRAQFGRALATQRNGALLGELLPIYSEIIETASRDPVIDDLIAEATCNLALARRDMQLVDPKERAQTERLFSSVSDRFEAS